MAKGKLIVIEGPDGAGKTTLCKTISDRLVTSNNSKCEIYSLPNKRSFGYRKMREMLTKVNTPTDVLQSIMIVNMQELLTKQIKKDLEDNTSVILDRWLISTIIYNTLNNGKLVDDMSTKTTTNKKLILDKISSDYCHIPIYPDYIFYLNIPKDIILKHASMRNSKEINDRAETVTKIYDLYQSFYNAATNNHEKFDSTYFVQEEDKKANHYVISPDTSIDIDDEVMMYKNIEDQIYNILKFNM